MGELNHYSNSLVFAQQIHTAYTPCSANLTNCLKVGRKNISLLIMWHHFHRGNNYELKSCVFVILSVMLMCLDPQWVSTLYLIMSHVMINCKQIQWAKVNNVKKQPKNNKPYKNTSRLEEFGSCFISSGINIACIFLLYP